MDQSLVLQLHRELVLLGLLLELLLHLFDHPLLGRDNLFDLRLGQLSLSSLLRDSLLLTTELSAQLGDLYLHRLLGLGVLLPCFLQFSLKCCRLVLQSVHRTLLLLQGLPQL